LELANYGLIMLALLTGAYRAESGGASRFGGPAARRGDAQAATRGAIFTDRALLRGRFRAVAAAAFYVFFATIAMWIISGIGPARDDRAVGANGRRICKKLPRVC